MSGIASVSAAPVVHHPPVHRRVMFAVSDAERALFFSGALAQELRAFEGASDNTLPNGRDWLAILESVQPEILVTCWSTPALPEKWLLVDDCPLRYVCHVTGSVRGVVPRAFLERGGHVTNWGGIASPQVAEHALLLALAALRSLPQWRTTPWGGDGMPATVPLGTRTLFGRRVGLHGFGRVANAIIELLKPFGVTFYAHSAGVPEEVFRSRNVIPCDSLVSLFSQSEVLFECEALTPQSEASVTAKVLAALPDGAVFVNVGRGRIVEEDALVREAASGRISVAADVIAEEPLSPFAPIGSLPDVILSPHIAGPTYDCCPQCGKLALENVQRYLDGEPLREVVSLDAYDRST